LIMQNNSDIKNFLSELGLDNVLNVEQDLGEGYVKLRISEAERRQSLQDIKSVEDIVIELLRNSRDAGAKNIFIGTKKIEDKKRFIYFIDDGKGIPKKFHDLIFEARITSKLENAVKDIYGFHGRGMALFSIKLNVEEIKVVYSAEDNGTVFFLDIDLNKIPEKKDQSVLPQIVELDGDLNIIGGVNNIPKTLVEFNLQNPDINIFYGTPSQIIMSMRNNMKNLSGNVVLPKFEDWDNLSAHLDVNKKIKSSYLPALSDDYLVLGKILKNFFNMEISERTIQRIIYEEFKPVQPLDIRSLMHVDSSNKTILPQKTKDTEKNRHLLLADEQKLAFRFKDEEISSIINIIDENIKKIGSKYLVESEGCINFKRSNNTIQINIALKEA
jgi:hypothetical protein